MKINLDFFFKPKNKFMKWTNSVVMGFLDNNCSMHAAGLTYFAMLALVPLLCIMLYAAKVADVDSFAREHINRQIDAMIVNIENGQDDEVAHLASMSEEDRENKKIAAKEFAREAREISDALFERIDQFNISTLGWIGFGFLLWTVVSSLGTVEISFNEIFNVDVARPVWKRGILYIFVTSILPMFLALAVSVPVLNLIKNVIVLTMGQTFLTQWMSDGLIWFLDSAIFRAIITVTIVSLNFAFLFWIIPNKKINFKSALYGGMITAILFALWMKACAVAQVGIAKSSALYGSFAFFPIILAWMYMSWQIILLGANIVHAFEECNEV